VANGSQHDNEVIMWSSEPTAAETSECPALTRWLHHGAYGRAEHGRGGTPLSLVSVTTVPVVR